MLNYDQSTFAYQIINDLVLLDIFISLDIIQLTIRY